MRMHVVEIDTDPVRGINLEALERAIVEKGVAACMVMPNFQNPLGFQMSDERKRALVKMLARHDVPVIENDVYHELYYGDAHPTSLKNYAGQHHGDGGAALLPAGDQRVDAGGRLRAVVNLPDGVRARAVCTGAGARHQRRRRQYLRHRRRFPALHPS
jgi:hypothetical protein